MFCCTKLTTCLLVALVAVSATAIGLLVVFLQNNGNDGSPCSSQNNKSVLNLLNSKNDQGLIMSAREPSPPPSPYDFYRLPRHVLPSAYDLHLHPNLVSNTFEGRVVISVRVTSPVDFLVVHEKNLVISETKVKRGDGSEVSVKAAFEYPKNEFWVVEFGGEIDPGDYEVHFAFSGSLVNGIVGFYKSEYFNQITGQKSALATTKFEPTNARRAFPCFDEPNMKATFNVTIAHEKEYIALSNMPSLGSNPREDGLMETHFDKSVAMSTYLVCFIVCDFKHKSSKTLDGKLFNVYATPNQVDNVDYALNAGVLVQNFYSDYYGVAYPLPKQDMIAIPDFAAGAMEHWGLVTYRETALLFDPKESAIQSQERVATVIAHELAHQWFGNLVTMDWWDDLWLNEGFASYVEYIGAGQIEPTWNMPEDVLVSDLQSVMGLDAGPGSHPIIQSVTNPDEITEIFDSISYSKGCSVLRMLDYFMGTIDFRKGLQAYLKKYSYGNAKTADLWEELRNASSKKLDINAIMDTWTKQMGFPVIHITRNPVKQSEFTATQERFFLLPDAAREMDRSESPFGYLWQVPLTYRQADGSTETTWLNNVDKLTFEIPEASNVDVVKFNVDQTGFYKVNYEEDAWNVLSKQLQEDHGKFSRPDRANLLDDALTLASGGYLSYAVALNVTKYLTKETDYLPWAAVNKEINTISELLESTDVYQLYRKYLLHLLTPIYNSIGWKDEGDHLTRKLRSLVLAKLCKYDHKDCLVEAERLLKRCLDGEFIPPNIRKVVYRFGISGSQGSEVWDAMWNKYLNTTLASEKMALLYGLSYTKQPWLIHRFLQYAKDESLIRGQDFFLTLGMIADNPSGTTIVWDYYRQEYSNLVKRFTLNDRLFGKFIVRVTQDFAEDFRLQEMLDFFAKYPDAGAGARARKQALEKVKQNIDWLKRNKETIKTWLSHNA